MYQSNFWRTYSTDILSLIDFVLTSIDKQVQTGMILIDLQKAFDTLNHGVLLEKIKYFGFQKAVMKWFDSYLSSRKFYVCIDNVFSEAGTLKYGVTQGSILGTLLFLINVNDHYESLWEAGSYLYADGTFFLPTWECSKNWKCFKWRVFVAMPVVHRP